MSNNYSLNNFKIKQLIFYTMLIYSQFNSDIIILKIYTLSGGDPNEREKVIIYIYFNNCSTFN